MIDKVVVDITFHENNTRPELLEPMMFATAEGLAASLDCPIIAVEGQTPRLHMRINEMLSGKGEDYFFV